MRKLFPHHFFLITNWNGDRKGAWALLEHYRKRGTFMFRAIGTATEVAKTRLAAPGGTDTHTLARGLCKTYATSANMVWYTAIRGSAQSPMM